MPHPPCGSPRGSGTRLPSRSAANGRSQPASSRSAAKRRSAPSSHASRGEEAVAPSLPCVSRRRGGRAAPPPCDSRRRGGRAEPPCDSRRGGGRPSSARLAAKRRSRRSSMPLTAKILHTTRGEKEVAPSSMRLAPKGVAPIPHATRGREGSRRPPQLAAERRSLPFSMCVAAKRLTACCGPSQLGRGNRPGIVSAHAILRDCAPSNNWPMCCSVPPGTAELARAHEA